MHRFRDFATPWQPAALRLLAVLMTIHLLAAPAPAETAPAAKPAAAKDGKAATPALNIPPDAAREQAVQEEFSRRLPASEVLLLDVDKGKVAALYTEQTAKQPRGAVLILPGMDRSADDPDLVRALRAALPKAGWSTLSLQLPLLPAGSPREAYGGVGEAARKRFQAALAQLGTLQQKNIVIVGMDLGGALALVAAPESKAVKGVVALSLDFVDGLNPPVDPTAGLDKLKVPVLDLYGALGGETTTRLAAQRRNAAAKIKQLQYTQAAVDGRNNRLEGEPSLIVNRVLSWLRKLKLDAPPAPP